LPYLKLLLIRHAQSTGNVQKRMEGQSSTSLTALGKQQAQQLAQSILPAPAHQPATSWPTHLYSSPLLRAQQTAHPLIDKLRRLDHPFQAVVDSRLQEIHQGVFQGLTWPEAQAQFPDLCAQLMSSLEWQPVPEAESPAAASARSHRWLQHILSTHRFGDTVWAISHAGIMLHLIAEIMGRDRTWQIDIAHTATFEFWLSRPSCPSGDRLSETPPSNAFSPEKWILKRFNQVISNRLAAPVSQSDRTAS